MISDLFSLIGMSLIMYDIMYSNNKLVLRWIGFSTLQHVVACQFYKVNTDSRYIPQVSSDKNWRLVCMAVQSVGSIRTGD